jgi:Acetyltransferase (GNAT) domain
MASIIRLASESDASAVAAIYRPIVEATATSFELQPPSDAEMRERITDTLRSHAWLVFEQRGEVAAYAYGTRHRSRPAYEWSVETSVLFMNDFVGRASDARCTSHFSLSYRCKGTSLRLPELSFRMRRVSLCTNASASRRSASIAESATSSVRGTTWVGGNHP